MKPKDIFYTNKVLNLEEIWYRYILPTKSFYLESILTRVTLIQSKMIDRHITQRYEILLRNKSVWQYRQLKNIFSPISSTIKCIFHENDILSRNSCWSICFCFETLISCSETDSQHNNTLESFYRKIKTKMSGTLYEHSELF